MSVITTATQLSDQEDLVTEWLVIAAICDCNRVAITVMDHWSPGTDVADTDEVVALGADYRTLIPYVARELHHTSGRPISGMCSVVYTRDPQRRAALTSEVVALVYETAER